jgi:hypothetical protein
MEGRLEPESATTVQPKDSRAMASQLLGSGWCGTAALARGGRQRAILRSNMQG